MKNRKTRKSRVENILALVAVMLFTSTNSLAELNNKGELYTQKGYPFEGLVKRSEEVAVFYSEQKKTVTCHVEVLQNGSTWKGKEKTTKLDKFRQKPLRSCMEREDAKKLLAKTYK